VVDAGIKVLRKGLGNKRQKLAQLVLTRCLFSTGVFLNRWGVARALWLNDNSPYSWHLGRYAGVFYTESYYWQCRVINSGAGVFGNQSFILVEAAEREQDEIF